MTKQYDGLYIFAGNAKDDVLESDLVKAVGELTRAGGTVISQVVLGKRSFARPMGKRESGVYALVRFELDPSKLAELVKRYRLVEEVVRVQFLAVNARLEEKLAAQREVAKQREAARQAAAAAAAEAAPEAAAE